MARKLACDAARRASRTAAIGLEMKTGKNHSRRDAGAKCIRNGKVYIYVCIRYNRTAPPRQRDTDYYYDYYTTTAAAVADSDSLFLSLSLSASLRSLAVSLAAIHARAEPNTIALVYDCVRAVVVV